MATLPIVGQFADIQAHQRRLWTHSLSWVLFLVGIFTYSHYSIERHRENPEDRVVPSSIQLWEGIKTSVLNPAEEDDALPDNAGAFQRVTHSMLIKDTLASSRRFIIAIAFLIPIVLAGLHMAVFPFAEAFFYVSACSSKRSWRCHYCLFSLEFLVSKTGQKSCLWSLALGRQCCSTLSISPSLCRVNG